MSGIAGLCRLDGRPVPRGDLERMLRAIAHRGPDGEGSWGVRQVALGHRMLHTTPESLAERQPLAARRETIVLTADARIDNRDELIRALGLAPALNQVITDCDLVLGAYRKWGEYCPRHLIGDFAFAVWDGEEQRLFCARDPFGVKPFYYHHRPGRLFGFASEIKGLLCLPEVPRRLNETRVGDFLQWFFDDEEITFYEGILRLPPAHVLVLTAEGIAVRRYWSLDPVREVRYRSNTEYAEAFREIFAQAVQCRLRSAFPVGSSLSGGLDSSSIVCTARELLRRRSAAPLHTFSLVFDGLPSCSERAYIEAVLEGGDLVAHLIPGDDLSPLQDLDTWLRYEDEASWVSNMCLHWAMHRAAAAEGVRVFLDGLGGDETVGHGVARLTELMRSGRLLELAVSAARLGSHFHRSPARILKRYAVRPLLPAWLLEARRGMRGGVPNSGPAIRPLVAPALAARTALPDRLQRWNDARPRAPNTTRGAHYLGLRAGINSAGYESLDRVAAAFSLEPRYPFQDRRLVEFCLALPAEQKLSWGWTRVSLRRAMAGVLPESIRWRGGKTDLSEQFERAFGTYERERIESVVYEHPEVIASFVNIPVLQHLYQEYTVGGKRQNAYQMWHPVMLALWLQRTGFTAAAAA